MGRSLGVSTGLSEALTVRRVVIGNESSPPRGDAIVVARGIRAKPFERGVPGNLLFIEDIHDESGANGAGCADNLSPSETTTPLAAMGHGI